MRPFLIRCLSSLALVLGLVPAQAAFHLFSIDEIYSNADGTVQFVELTALAGGQQFIAGHTITARSGGTTRTFTVTANLPGDTGGKKFLIGTQGFAALGVVAPDVVVPNGFFFTPSGTVDWAGADVWNYAGLPADGNLSLNRDGSTAANSPTNFAGATGHVNLSTAAPPAPPQPTTSYEGLWWRSPAGSESGWGINLTHQGDILFATWFTYDTDGSGMWLVVPSANRTQGTTYQGAAYRTTGPSFDTFNSTTSATLQFVQVGAVSFTFTDENNGTFDYSVNGTTQRKNITKQIYDAKVPSCFVGGSTGSAPVYQDLWWRAPAGSESGWGLNIAHQGDTLFVTWFTYGADRKGLWMVGPAVKKTTVAKAYPPGEAVDIANTYSGKLYRTSGPVFSASPWDPNAVRATEVGSVTLTFNDANNATFAYTVNGISQSKPITRQDFATPQTVCK